MNTNTFKKHLLTLILILFCGTVSHAADDLITQQITIKLEGAGTLPDRIGSTKKNQITNLKIVGEINGTDLRFIREMAGSDYEGNSTSGSLSILDLSEAKIVEGGACYFNASLKYTTSNNKMGENAFYKCDKLNDITMPSSVTSIGNHAFDGCSGLTSVTIPSSVTSIDYCAFNGCSSLTSITIPSSVIEIGSCAFYGCSSLTSITIPSSVTEIGHSAFLGCSSVTSITIPSSVTKIDYNTFQDCNSLTNITIPSSVTEIGHSAFRSCN